MNLRNENLNWLKARIQANHEAQRRVKKDLHRLEVELEELQERQKYWRNYKGDKDNHRVPRVAPRQLPRRRPPTRKMPKGYRE